MVRQWDAWDPGAGDMGDLEAIEGYLRLAAERADTLYTLMSAVNQNITDDIWSGPARDIWGEEFCAEYSKLPAMSENFTTAADGIRAYVNTVTEIKSVVDPALDQIEACDASARGVSWLTWRASGLPHQRVFTVCAPPSVFDAEGFTLDAPTPVAVAAGYHPVGPVDSMTKAQAWADYLSHASARLAERIGEQVSVRQNADDTLAAVWDAVMGDWADEVARYGDVGITDPSQMTEGAYAAALAQAYLDQGGRYTDGTRGTQTTWALDQVEVFLQENADNPTAVALFVLALGGEGTVRLSSDLMDGASAHRPNVDATATLKSGFIAATYRGSPSQVEGLIDGFFTTPQDVNTVAAAAYFFQGEVGKPTTWVSPVAASRAATLIDTYERESGKAFTAPSVLGGSVPYIVPLSVLLGSPETIDGASGVFQSLAQYPGAATAWLTVADEDPLAGGKEEADRDGKLHVPTVGEARRAHWFGQRDWYSTGDGFTSPAMLLAATQVDFTLDPATGNAIDPDASRTAAVIFSDCAWQLAHSQSLLDGHLSPEASVYLAEAMNDNWVAAMQAYELDKGKTAGQLGRADAFHGDTFLDDTISKDMPLAGISPATWSTLLHEVQYDGQANAVLVAGVEDYKNTLLAISRVDPAGDPGKHTRDIVERMSRAYGELGMARSGGTMDAAGDRDAAVSDTINTWTSAASTGASLIPGPQQLGATLLLPSATEAANGWLTDYYATDQRQTVPTINSDTASFDVETREITLQTAAQDLGITLPPVPQGEYHSAARRDWYDQAVRTIDEELDANGHTGKSVARIIEVKESSEENRDCQEARDAGELCE